MSAKKSCVLCGEYYEACTCCFDANYMPDTKSRWLAKQGYVVRSAIRAAKTAMLEAELGRREEKEKT